MLVGVERSVIEVLKNDEIEASELFDKQLLCWKWNKRGSPGRKLRLVPPNQNKEANQLNVWF